MEPPNINLTATSADLAESEKCVWKHYNISFCFNSSNDLIGMSFVQVNPTITINPTVQINPTKSDKNKDLINSLATSKGEAVPETITTHETISDRKKRMNAERDKEIVEKVMKARKEGNYGKAEFLGDKLNKKAESKKNYKDKVCVDCGEVFSPSGPRSKRCDKCSSKKKNNKKENSDEDGRGELKVCPKCHNNFIPLDSNQVFCSSCEKETMKTKKCVVCGEDFIPNAPNHKCCSDKCRAIRLKSGHKRKKKEYREEKICKRCNHKFIATKKSQVYCSTACRLTFVCKKCGKNFVSNGNIRICPECKKEKKINNEGKKKKYKSSCKKISKKPEEGKDLLTGKDFCPICLEKKPPFKNTCGIKYKCISTWNKLNDKQRERLLKETEAYAQSYNKKHGKRRKADTSDGLGESLEVFSNQGKRS